MDEHLRAAENEDKRRKRDNERLCQQYFQASAPVYDLLTGSRPLPTEFSDLLIEVGGSFASISMRNGAAAAKLRLAVGQVGSTMVATGLELREGKPVEAAYLHDAHAAVERECRHLDVERELAPREG